MFPLLTSEPKVKNVLHMYESSKDRPRILLGICTRKRAKEFSVCLDSVKSLLDADRYQLTLVVVENSSPDYAKDIVTAKDLPIQVMVINQTNPGISSSRNAVVSYFLRSDAEWLALIDDDEVIHPDWLNEMFSMMGHYPQSLGFAGPTYEILENDRPPFLARTYKGAKQGQFCPAAGAGNVLLNRYVFDDDGLRLRFPEAFSLSGGEDTALFLEMACRGHVVLWAPHAICTETLATERSKIVSRLGIPLRQGMNTAHIKYITTGKIKGRLRSIVDIILFGLRGVGYAVRLAPTAMVRPSQVKATFEDMCQNFAFAFGIAGAFFSLRSRHYK